MRLSYPNSGGIGRFSPNPDAFWTNSPPHPRSHWQPRRILDHHDRTPSRQHQTRVFPDFPAPIARTRLVSWRLIPCRSGGSQPGRAESKPIRTHTVALETENRREPHNLCGYKQENGRISLDHGGGAQGVQIFDVLVEEQVVELVDA